MLSDVLKDKLAKNNMTFEDFQELMIRLMNYGVLCRTESQTEQLLYDRFLRITDLVQDYLKIIGIKIYHDTRFEYIRLYPPGSLMPGMAEAEAQAFSGSLRTRITQNEVALILVLRTQYDKALREGNVDEHGYVAESMESLVIALRNLLGRSLPEKMTDRRRLFQRLRQLRLIQYSQDEELESGDSWIKIHPMIVSFVDDEALLALEQNATEETTEEEIVESTVVEGVTEGVANVS